MSGGLDFEEDALGKMLLFHGVVLHLGECGGERLDAVKSAREFVGVDRIRH